jgi:outer membrane protein assembly factor BamE
MTRMMLIEHAFEYHLQKDRVICFLMQTPISFLLYLLVAMTAACSPFSFPYQIDIQQGNVVNQEMLSQLRPGMTKRQVKFIMGTPLLIDTFHADRWDYYYSIKPGGKPREQRQITLYFSGDQLARIEGDIRPAMDTSAPAPRGEQVVVVPARPEKKGFFEGLFRSSSRKGDVTKEPTEVREPKEPKKTSESPATPESP